MVTVSTDDLAACIDVPGAFSNVMKARNFRPA
jgi:hypothetical protein